MTAQRIEIVKVFSATRRAQRDALGDRVTAWLRSHPEVTLTRTTVLLSSDAQYHCLSIVLVGRME